MPLLPKHIHFIGISGIGMSGLAKIMKQQGHIVSGCDSAIDEKHVKELKELGCFISSHHLGPICHDSTIDTIVHTSSISKDHPELLRGSSLKINILHRAQLLAYLMEQKKSIAIAGSHGKTSTTALVAHILLQANLDPTVIIGGHSSSIKSNAYYGSGSYLVAETDESDRSFLIMPKNYAITTNIDMEHLETYHNFDDIKNTFLNFINSTPQDGINVICIDNPGIQSISEHISSSFITYGQSTQAEIQLKNIQLYQNHSSFDIYKKSNNTVIGHITMSQPGIHYAMNATGAIALALHLSIPFSIIQSALSSFQGVDRRFSFCGITKQEAHIFDDYGHHPLEIYHALLLARQKTKNNVVVVFQPHRYTRTKFLWNDFIKIFAQSSIDTLIITDIFAANELPIENIDSKQLAQAIKKESPHKTIIYLPYTPEMLDILATLEQTLKKDDLLLLLGAGKVNKLATKLIT
ncbi:UDP-N-acetylmuramate--L-alanine ligase [Candidatus Dependentiae bacterium]|nr:UDP-N-acetylmuramate--L-alanine ligase [Candidatus Dependentiae bacterium]